MNNLEALKAQIAELEEQRTIATRKRAQALADMAELPRMSADFAHAKATAAKAETHLDQIAAQLEARAATIAALEARRDLMADPEFEAATQATIAEALALRADLDKRLSAVAKKTDALVAALGELQELEAEIARVDPGFDKYQAGRASVCTWLADAVSGYTGRGRLLAADKPTQPGAGFAGPEMIARNLREAASARAARIVRQRELTGGEAA